MATIGITFTDDQGHRTAMVYSTQSERQMAKWIINTLAGWCVDEDIEVKLDDEKIWPTT